MSPLFSTVKTPVFFSLAKILIVLIACTFTACGSPKPPLSPQAIAFKQEIRGLLTQLQNSLAEPLAQGDKSKLDAVLKAFTKNTADICVDCPYRSAVLDYEGVLQTTFPKNEIVGRNFSSYKFMKAALQKQQIRQSKAFLPDGTNLYYISAPLIYGKKVVGVAVICLTPNDIQQKWRLGEEEFLAIDFNVP